MRCDAPVRTSNGLGQCRKCPRCKDRQRRFVLGRLGAEAHTSKCVLFATLTYDDQHLETGRSLPLAHVKSYFASLRRKYAVAHFTVGEYGEKTGRPHWHSLLFFQDVVPEFPLNFSSRYYGWSRGNSQYEVPRSMAGSAGYLYDYLDKGGLAVRPSPGLGKRYLLNWACLAAEQRRHLAGPYGIVYTVPGVVTPQGKLWKYTIPSGHRYSVQMADQYIQRWRHLYGTDPDWTQFDRINCNG